MQKDSGGIFAAGLETFSKRKCVQKGEGRKFAERAENEFPDEEGCLRYYRRDLGFWNDSPGDAGGEFSKTVQKVS